MDMRTNRQRHTCDLSERAFGRRHPGCPRCDELVALVGAYEAQTGDDAIAASLVAASELAEIDRHLFARNTQYRLGSILGRVFRSA